MVIIWYSVFVGSVLMFWLVFWFDSFFVSGIWVDSFWCLGHLVFRLDSFIVRVYSSGVQADSLGILIDRFWCSCWFVYCSGLFFLAFRVILFVFWMILFGVQDDLFCVLDDLFCVQDDSFDVLCLIRVIISQALWVHWQEVEMASCSA